MGSWLPFRMVRKSRNLCCHMYENEQFRKKRWSMISLRIVLAQKNIPWTIIIRFSCYFSANNMVITIWIDNFGIIMDFHVIQKEDSNIFQQWTPTTIIPCIFTILWIICGLDYHYHVFFKKKHSSRYYIKIPHSKPLFSFATSSTDTAQSWILRIFPVPVLGMVPAVLGCAFQLVFLK